jgi:hypothetical protein
MFAIGEYIGFQDEAFHPPRAGSFGGPERVALAKRKKGASSSGTPERTGRQGAGMQRPRPAHTHGGLEDRRSAPPDPRY